MKLISAFIFLLLLICLFPHGSFTASVEGDKSPMIIGGTTAAVGEFPYMAGIRLKFSKTFACGASILDHRWILTAAHCFEHSLLPTFNFEVFVGTNNCIEGGETYSILDIQIHPNYNFTTKASDIALVKLARDIKLDNHTQPISLAKKAPGENSTVTLSGWGFIDNHQTQPTLLRKINLSTISTHRCGQLIETNPNELPICTLASVGHGTCHGDSGGPLVLHNTLVGVTSYGPTDKCATGEPDVFSNVGFFHNWIHGITGIP